MDCGINLSLQRLSIISYAKWFWDVPDIKYKLKYYSSCVKTSGYSLEDYWEKLVKSVATNLKTSHLPELLLNELNYAIISMGWRIYQWRVFVAHTLSLPEEFMEPIYWTPYGTIDKAKIVEKEWLNMTARVTRSMESNTITAIHYMTCSCAIGSHINRFRVEILNKNYSNNEFFKRTDVGKSASHSFIRSSLLFFDKFLTGNSDTTGRWMFETSMATGNDVAVQFYWNLLNPEEKSNPFVLKTLWDCLDRLSPNSMRFRRIWGNHTTYHRRQYFKDAFVFVVAQMLKLQGDLLFNKRINSFKLLLLRIFISVKIWPWQELFFPLFEVMKEMFDLSNYYELLDDIFEEMKITINYLVCDVQKGIHYKMFLTVWNALQVYRSVENAPLYPFNNSNGLVNNQYGQKDRTLKYHSGRTRNAFKYMIQSAFKLFIIDILTQISDSECDDQGRLFFFSLGNYNELITENKFELLNKFLKVVLKDKERSWFYKTNDFFAVFINDDELETVEKILNWKLNSGENLTNQSDVIWVCSYLYFKGSIDILEKTLNHCFPNEEQKEQYLCDHDNATWLFKSLTCHGESKTSEFLNWFTGSKKKSFQIKKKLINGASLESYLKLLVEQSEDLCDCGDKFISNQMDRLLNYCSLSPNEIKNLKKKISNNINYYVLFLNRLGRLVAVEDFLSWLYKKKTKVFINTFLHSPDAVAFFKDIIRSCFFETSKSYLVKWIKISRDVKKMKSYFDEAFVADLEVDSREWNNLQDLKRILDELKTKEKSVSV